MRALKALVIFMGVLIVAGVGVLAWMMIGIANRPPADKGATALSLGLPAECAIASVVAAGERLAVVAEGPSAAGCRRIWLVDPARMRVVGTIEP
ncbi:MAG: hypothetical protein AB7N54_13455 [Alphaproteobacteria bacterium]